MGLKSAWKDAGTQPVQINPMPSVLTMYAIYYDAPEYPGKYVIKKWYCKLPVEMDPNYHVEADSLEECEARPELQGLFRMGPTKDANESPYLIGTWF